MFAPLPFRLTVSTVAGRGENLGARRYERGRDEHQLQLRPRRTNARQGSELGEDPVRPVRHVRRLVRMIGARPEIEAPRYPASELAAKYGAAAARETEDPDEAYADWPGDYVPLRLPWPL